MASLKGKERKRRINPAALCLNCTGSLWGRSQVSVGESVPCNNFQCCIRKAMFSFTSTHEVKQAKKAQNVLFGVFVHKNCCYPWLNLQDKDDPSPGSPESDWWLHTYAQTFWNKTGSQYRLCYFGKPCKFQERYWYTFLHVTGSKL